MVNRVIEAYVDAPAGCAIDMGVTSGGRTLLVEVNDGYALGCYGMDSVAYALLLAARWAELVGVEDELERLNSRGFEHGFCEMTVDRSVIRILDHVEGASPGYSGIIASMAEWMDAIDDFSRYVESGDKNVEDIWRWIAKRQRLDIEKGPDGNEYLFPRRLNMRYVVEVSSADSRGYSIIKRFDKSSAIVFPWVHETLASDSLRFWLYSRLADCSEADAAEMGMKSIFVIMEDDDDSFPDAAFYEARGYHKAPCKDEEDTARALGAHVIHDFIMEKSLDGD